MNTNRNAIAASCAAQINSLSKFFIFAVFALLASFATAQQLDSTAIENAEIMNLRNPEANVFASGQPTQEQLQLLAKSGVKHIINLRPSSEQEDWDEGAYVKSLGMEYHNIPVAGAAGVSSENAQQLNDLLSSLNGQPLLVHCASSNRVGALRALTAGETNGAALESAIATGKSWGLTSLEPAVRAKLSD
jgi:uncharacterized protein (TIGR01244 family)